jgi:hypothetical protein
MSRNALTSLPDEMGQLLYKYVVCNSPTLPDSLAAVAGRA